MTPDEQLNLTKHLNLTFKAYPFAKVEPETVLLFVATLSRYPLPAVAQALDEHVIQSSRPPSIADIVARIHITDGRPGPEEAWAKCCMLTDERASIVWTEEMNSAWFACSDLAYQNDLIAARKAFTERYVRDVNLARGVNKPVRWTLSPGRDVTQRVVAVREAVRLGRLTANEARIMLPHLREEFEPKTNLPTVGATHA